MVKERKLLKDWNPYYCADTDYINNKRDILNSLNEKLNGINITTCANDFDFKNIRILINNPFKIESSKVNVKDCIFENSALVLPEIITDCINQLAYFQANDEDLSLEQFNETILKNTLILKYSILRHAAYLAWFPHNVFFDAKIVKIPNYSEIKITLEDEGRTILKQYEKIDDEYIDHIISTIVELCRGPNYKGSHMCDEYTFILLRNVIPFMIFIAANLPKNEIKKAENFYSSKIRQLVVESFAEMFTPPAEIDLYIKKGSLEKYRFYFALKSLDYERKKNKDKFAEKPRIFTTRDNGLGRHKDLFNEEEDDENATQGSEPEARNLLEDDVINTSNKSESHAKKYCKWRKCVYKKISSGNISSKQIYIKYIEDFNEILKSTKITINGNNYEFNTTANICLFDALTRFSDLLFFHKRGSEIFSPQFEMFCMSDGYDVFKEESKLINNIIIKTKQLFEEKIKSNELDLNTKFDPSHDFFSFILDPDNPIDLCCYTQENIWGKPIKE